MKRQIIFRLAFIIYATINSLTCYSQPLERLSYNLPGLLTDLGVRLWAWPLPMDYNENLPDIQAVLL